MFAERRIYLPRVPTCGKRQIPVGSTKNISTTDVVDIFFIPCPQSVLVCKANGGRPAEQSKIANATERSEVFPSGIKRASATVVADALFILFNS